MNRKLCSNVFVFRLYCFIFFYMWKLRLSWQKRLGGPILRSSRHQLNCEILTKSFFPAPLSYKSTSFIQFIFSIGHIPRWGTRCYHSYPISFDFSSVSQTRFLWFDGSQLESISSSCRVSHCRVFVDEKMIFSHFVDNVNCSWSVVLKEI